jgi:Putative DNA-binding domain
VSRQATELATATRSLAELQTVFFQAITTPQAAPLHLDERAAAALLTASATLTARERLELYRDGYHARLIECLADDYPALQHALGEAEFESLCRDYIVARPSLGPNLNVYGRHMPEFCRSYAHVDSAFLSELAALEWAIARAVHAAGGAALQPADLADVAPDVWPHVKLIVNPALAVLTGQYPVNAYFQAWRAGESPAIPAPSPSVVAVYRTGRSVWRLPLNSGMAQLLALLAAGKPLADATLTVTAQLTLDGETEAVNLVTRWFSTAVSSGLFSGLELPHGT